KSSLAKILARSHEKKSSSQLLFFICSISFKKMSISGMINYGKPVKRNRLLRCMDMANILKKIFGDGNQRQLNRVQKIVNHIEAMEPDMEKLSDSELQHKTEEFKDRYQNGETLDDIIIEKYEVGIMTAQNILY